MYHNGRRNYLPRFLSLFGGQCLGWFQIEVVVEMQIVEILAMDEKVEHVVSLLTNLKPNFNPIQLSGLKELRST